MCPRVSSTIVAELGRTLPHVVDVSLEVAKTVPEGRASAATNLCTHGCAHDHARASTRTRADTRAKARAAAGAELETEAQVDAEAGFPQYGWLEIQQAQILEHGRRVAPLQSSYLRANGCP